MIKNVGTIDRLLRLIAAGYLLYLGLSVYPHTQLGLGLEIGAGVLGLTALVGTCLMYRLLGINTCKTSSL
jgi:hypothetical protein